MEDSSAIKSVAQNEPLIPPPLPPTTSTYNSTEECTADSNFPMPEQGDNVEGQSTQSTLPDTETSSHIIQQRIISRMPSTPSALEAPPRKLLSQDSDEEAVARTSNQGMTSSTATGLKPSAELPPQTISKNTSNQVVDTPIAREDFVQFINSPRGQNAIVEQSPEGRYVRFMEKLGSGASKDVYRAYDTTEGIEVAWNVVNLAGVPKNERNRIVNEVRLLERLHHQNIISFHGSWVNRERQEVNFVTEILSSGTLKSFIEKVQVIRWKIAKRWAIQILKGLDYLHSQEPPVIHRDLKCDNIFINGTSGDLRIGDLGLSTVHRNGKVLSVLGTPEFMAPDVYEESAYDEKVDIYAFGMCLLEIFTKEIPYRECNNAAQIYKKVLRGELPSNLHRLKSENAREFIMLCLGYKDEHGKYIRPSAAELLTNPFLQKSDYDDDEVEVLQRMQERPIMESPGDTRQPNSHSQELRQPQSDNEKRNKAEVARPTNWPSDNSLEEESDRFDEMPDSEVNMKRVTVLMGRGEELKDDKEQELIETEDDDASPNLRNTNALMTPQMQTNDGDASRRSERVDSISQATGFVVTSASEGQRFDQQRVSDIHQQYLVAAAVIEEDSPQFVPYEDDMLKLIITLPVEGQPQNVQFDFHLVQDDPVQVAREMVAELSIPQEAILEISETISGIARQARMKQDKYNSVRWQNQQGPVQQGQQQVGVITQHKLPESSQQSHQALVYHHHQQTNQSGQSSDSSSAVQVQRSSHPDSAAVYHQQQQPNQGGQKNDLPGVVQFQGSSQAEAMHIYHQPQQSDLKQQQHQTLAYHQQQTSQPNQSGQSSDVSGVAHSQMSSQSVSARSYPLQQQQSSEDAAMVQFQSSSQTEPMHLYHQPQQAEPTQQPQGAIVYHQQQQQQPNQAGQSSDSSGIPQFHGSSQNESSLAYQQPQQQSLNEVSGALQFHHPSQTESVLVYHQTQQPSQSGPPSEVSSTSQFQISLQTELDHRVVSGNASQLAWQHQMQAQSVAINEESSSILFHQHVPVPPQGNDPLLSSTSSLNSLLYHSQTSPSTGNMNGEIDMMPPPSHVIQTETIPQYSQQFTAPTAPQSEQVQSLSSNQVVPPSHQSVAPLPTVLSVAQPVMSQSVMSQNNYDTGASDLHAEVARQIEDVQTPGTDDEEEDDEEELAEEIRRLDEDFQKNMLRAQKVFDNRMDNLQRSKLEKEFQHQKTLEKHEKERIEFERRAKQEEAEQQRRIDEMQREWDRKRDELAKAKAKKLGGGTKKAPGPPRPLLQSGQGQNAVSFPQPSTQGQGPLSSTADQEPTSSNAVANQDSQLVETNQ